MIPEFSIQLTPPAAAILQQARAFPAAMLQAMARELDLQLELTVGHIQRDHLSQRGPRSLGVVTNRLRSSIRPRKATIVGDTIIAAIGTNVSYAAPHEFGFRGRVQVPAHERRYARFEGKPISLKDAKGIRGKKLKEKLATGASMVRAHTRNMVIIARAPIRTGIRERLPAIGQALSRAIERAWNAGAQPPSGGGAA